jgi:hypothetical protein
MGNDLRHKGLLLDEADFALSRDCDMASLVEAVEAYCMTEFSEECEHPSLEIFGVVSERLEETSAWACEWTRAQWVRPGVGFRDIFLGVARNLGIPDPLASEALDTGRTEQIETHLKNRIRAHLDTRDYDAAQGLMQHLPTLRPSGLPGVKGAEGFDTRGDDMIVDYRVNDYGAGRRILVEIAFNWGQ